MHWHLSLLAFYLYSFHFAFFSLIFGELVPKRLGMKYHEKIAFSTVEIIKTISNLGNKESLILQ